MTTHYNTVTYHCGCVHAYKWEEEDDPHHRAHHVIDDQELHNARVAHGHFGPLPEAFRRVGCDKHWHKNPVKHAHRVHQDWHQGHPDYRPEYHDTGFTVHYEPKETVQ